MSCGSCLPAPCAPCVPAQFCQPENFGLTFPSLVGPPGPPGSTVLFVATYAAARLLNLASAIAGTVVNVGGHTTVNDGGQGAFSYSPTSAEADNDGTILDPIGPGRLLRIFSGPVNAQWFGLRASASASSNIAALQAAWDYCATLERELFIPEGTYNLASSLLVTAQGVNISGDGPGTVLNLTGINQSVIDISGAGQRDKQTTIRDIFLTATSKTGTYGIHIHGPLKFTFSGVECDSLDVGFYSEGMQFCTIRGLVCENNNVGVRHAPDPVDGGGNNNLWVDLEVTSNIVGIVAYKNSAFPFHNNRFVNPIIFGNSVCGVYWEGGSSIDFDHASPEGNATAGAPYVFEGKTIKVGLWHLVTTQITLDNYTHVSGVANAVNLETSSFLTIRNATTAEFQSLVSDGTSGINFVGNTKLYGKADNVVAAGAMTASGTQQHLVGPPSTIEGGFNNEVPSDPCTPLLVNVVAPTTWARETVEDYGVVDAIQFDAAGVGIGFGCAFAMRLTDFANGEKFYCSLLVRADIDCDITIDYAQSVANRTYSLKAGAWTKIQVAASNTSGLVRGAGIVVYVNNNSAPKINLTRLFSSTYTTDYQLACLFNWQPFNFNLPVRNYGSIDAGNADYTVDINSPLTILFNTPITADRDLVLPPDSFARLGARYGARYRIVRTAAATGAFDVIVTSAGTGTLKVLAPGEWCDVEVSMIDNVFHLIGFGAL